MDAGEGRERGIRVGTSSGVVVVRSGDGGESSEGNLGKLS